MKTFFRILSLLFLLFVVCAAGNSQQVINPAAQVRWPAVTGTVDPAGPFWNCTATNYGQPYTNVTSGVLFFCTASGWKAAGSGTISGQLAGYAVQASSPTTATVNFPLDYNVTLANSMTAHKPFILGDGTAAGALSFRQGTAPGSTVAGAIQFFAPTSVTAYNMLLPAAQGTGALFNDGAGNLSWNPSAGGSLTGQTVNFVPQATSSTASSVSTHFYEATDHSYSGLSNPFLLSASAPNCILVGPTFTKWGCHNVNTLDDGSSYGLSGATAGLAGFTFNMNAWGGHAGFDGFEGRTTQVYADSFNAAIVTAGIKQIHASNTSTFGIGDTAVEQNDHLCLGGAAYGSDEGCKFFRRIGETAPSWTATVAGGSNTAPTSTSSGGCFGLENEACAPIPGGWMIDSSVSRGSGHGTGLSSGGPGSVSWVGTIATDFAPTASTAWGYAINANLTSNTSWEAPVSQTFTLQGGAGTFAVGDHACMIGTQFTEQNVISAVSGTSPTQTITMPLAMPETSVAIFKGDCMIMSFDAAAAVGIQYGIPAVSIDGSHILASSEGYSQNIPLVWNLGQQWWTLDGGARSGIHLYGGSRITYVETTNTTTPGAAWAPGNQIPHLMPNSVFSVGDTMISAHYETQLVTGLDLTSIQNMPGGPLGINIGLNGHGVSGSSFGIRLWNEEPTTSYIQYGGPLNEPTAIDHKGVWDTGVLYEIAPQNYVTHVFNHQTGQTSYDIFRDDTWGEFQIDASGFHFTTDVYGGSYNSFGIVTGGVGLVAGSGDGAGNSAGVSFTFPSGSGLTPTWLTQCSVDPFGGGNGTDLCITDQGTSRVATNVTANRGLQLRYLTVADNGAGHNGTITFLNNYGVDAIDLFASGADKYYWGLNAGEMQFGVQDNTTTHFSFNAGSGGLQPSGTNEYFRLTPRTSGGGMTIAGGQGYCFSNSTTSAATADTCIWRDSAGTFHMGNGTTDDNTGLLSLLEVDAFNIFPNHITTTTANSDLAGTITLSGGVGTYTFITTWTHAPVCTATDTTAVAAVQATATTGVLTINGTGTDSVNYICVARL